MDLSAVLKVNLLAWRSTSWTHNIWTSVIVAVVSAQILWLAVGFLYGFDRAATLTDEYLWYLVGSLFIVFFTIRAPRPNRASGGATNSRTEPDA